MHSSLSSMASIVAMTDVNHMLALQIFIECLPGIGTIQGPGGDRDE